MHEENDKKARTRARFGVWSKIIKKQSINWGTIWCTKKTTKKHNLVYEEKLKKKTRFGTRRKHKKKHDLVHEENDKKARTRARFRVWNKIIKKKSINWGTIWCTKKTTKKHDLVHEKNHKKARFGARRKLKKSTIWCTKKKPEKNTIWCTKKTRKKHDSIYEENP